MANKRLQSVKKAKKGILSVIFSRVFVLSALIIIVYALRYYSFFTNPMWEAFYNYKTIFGLIM